MTGSDEGHVYAVLETYGRGPGEATHLPYGPVGEPRRIDCPASECCLVMSRGVPFVPAQ